MKLITLDTNYIVKEHRSGRTMKDIARELGVGFKVILRHLQEAGISRRIAIDVDAIAQRYVDGESILALAKSLAVSRSVIQRRLLEANVSLRNQSAAETLRWSQRTPAQRKNQVAAAHAATKGSTQPMSALLARARTVQERQLHIPQSERALAKMLSQRGVNVIHQQAIGPYNCDLGAYPVAVEIFGGNWHWHGRHLLRSAERFRYILNAGWHVLALWITPKRHPLTAAAADYVVTFLEQARSDPSATRQYRVIRGAGEIVASGSANDDKIAIVPALRSGRDSLGRYTSIPR